MKRFEREHGSVEVDDGMHEMESKPGTYCILFRSHKKAENPNRSLGITSYLFYGIRMRNYKEIIAQHFLELANESR
jgi:hypothetical protein